METLPICLICGTMAAAVWTVHAQAIDESQWKLFQERIVQMETAPTRVAIQAQRNIGLGHGVDEAPIVREKDLAKLQKLFQESGTFRGVDYSNQNRSDWKTLTHLEYCRQAAIALHVYPRQVQARYQVREICLKSLDWWLTHQPKNPNWWNNEVYVPLLLSNIMLLIDNDAMTPERRACFHQLTSRIRPSRTGQNKLWMSWNSFLAALVERDAQRVNQALEVFSKTICISRRGEEGIQPDMSFQQHGPMFYQGNYGLHYLHSAAKYAVVTAGTPWERSDRRDLVERYLLDGTRWMCWGSLLDYSAWGRQISYNGREQGPTIIHVCRMLASVNSPRRRELDIWSSTLTQEIGSFNPNSQCPETVTGTRAFPYSDYLVHRTATWMTTLRLSSTRTIAGEECNGDNLKGAYLGDGCMFVYKNSGEYRDIFPAWDWSCIPGVTSRRGELPAPPKWSGRRGGSSFAVVDDSGIAAMSLNRFGLTANKSWFVYPDRIVCIGSDIQYSNDQLEENDGSIVTTVEQNLLETKQEQQTLRGDHVQGVLYGNSLYLFPLKTELIHERARRTGSWKSIRSASDPGSVTQNIFLLAVNHGKNPQSAGYVYHVLPQGSKLLGEQSADRLWDDVNVINTSDNVHAVEYQGETRIVFFEPSSCKLSDGRIVKVKVPCALTIPEGNNAIRACLPGGRGGCVEVTLDNQNLKIHVAPIDRS